MKVSKLLILSAVIIITSCQLKKDPEKEQNEGTSNSIVTSSLELVADEKLRIINLVGTPYERGVQHGNLLKGEIKSVTDSLLIDIEKTTNENPLDFIKKFLEETDFISSMEKWTPELLEEIKGISDGSEISHEIILMHQLGDEFFFSTKYLFAHKCSSIGIDKSDDHPAIAAQNMDIPTFFHGYQTVMRIIEESGKESLVLTIPGHIGISGMNNLPVSINCNILMQLKSQSKGLPVSSIVRGILNKTSYTDAINWINEIEHASGQNYIIGGSNKTVSLECSADSIKAFKPFENAAFTYHTNHPFRNKDFSDWYLSALDENGFTLFEAQKFCQRISSFQKRFNKENMDFGIEEIKEVLSSRDHDGFDVVSNTYTYASLIYILSDKPKFMISPGKPHETEYITLEFQK